VFHQRRQSQQDVFGQGRYRAGRGHEWFLPTPPRGRIRRGLQAAHVLRAGLGRGGAQEWQGGQAARGSGTAGTGIVRIARGGIGMVLLVRRRGELGVAASIASGKERWLTGVIAIIAASIDANLSFGFGQIVAHGRGGVTAAFGPPGIDLGRFGLRQGGRGGGSERGGSVTRNGLLVPSVQFEAIAILYIYIKRG
jgi:hypothetical protein